MARVYNFTADFNDNVWINGGTSYNKPLSVMLGISGKANVDIVVYKGNTKVGSVTTGLFEGAINFPISHLTKSGGFYKIQLDNRRYLKPVVVTNGQLYYT